MQSVSMNPNSFINAEFSKPTYPTRSLNINIKDIKMDDYQRPIDADGRKVIENMVKNYDPNRDRPIELSYRDGKYWCFDGQHRLKAHEIMGDYQISAQVHYGLTHDQEARLFALQNENTRRVTTRDTWNAKTKARNECPNAQDIIKICSEYGFEIDIDPWCHLKKKNVFSCVRELQNIYERHGANGLRIICAIIRDAWIDLPSNTHREIVAGLGKMIETYYLKGSEWERLARRLSKMTPKALLQASNTGFGRGQKRVARYMVKLYNNGLTLRSGNRLDDNKIR